MPSVHPPLPAAALDNSTPYHFLSLSQSQCLPSDNETSPSVWLAAGSFRLISCINFDDDADDDDTDWCAWNILIETMLLEVSLLLHICNPYPISNIQASTGPSTYRVSHNWVFTLFWLFSWLPVLVQMFILPFFNSPGDDNSKTHLTFLPTSNFDQVTEQNVRQTGFRYYFLVHTKFI